MREEEALRDQLAYNLSLIDPELRLIQKEYPLPNDIGSKGFVGGRVLLWIMRQKIST